MTVTLELELPEGLGLDERELKWHLVAKLFDRRLVTRSQARRMLGVSVEEFITGVGRYEVSILQYEPGELEAELEGIRRRHEERTVAT